MFINPYATEMALYELSPSMLRRRQATGTEIVMFSDYLKIIYGIVRRKSIMSPVKLILGPILIRKDSQQWIQCTWCCLLELEYALYIYDYI